MRIKTSKRIDEITEYLTKLYKFKYEGTIVRIAFAYSIQLNIKFENNSEIIEPSDGKDWRDERALFGSSNNYRPHLPIFKSVINQHYERNVLDEEFVNLFKKHVLSGLEKIYNDLEGKNIVAGYHIKYLMTIVNNGLLMSGNNYFINHNNENEERINISATSRLISFDLGHSDNSELVKINLNKDFEPQHIAIAGMTRSGKTELVKHILYQIHKISEKELKFIFLDYKGEGQSDTLSKFLNSTDCEFIDIAKTPFEFNPLSSIELKDKRIQDQDITALVDAIASVESKLGVSQKHILRSIITKCFTNSKGKIPTFTNVFVEIEVYYAENNNKPDTLFDIIEQLSKVFKEPIDYSKKIYNNNLYLNLPATASDSYRKATVFSVLKYIFSEFIKSETVVQNKEGIKPMKYIIVIDEAHVYMRDKSSRKILEDFLRLISSKGVSVILLSQGVEDYKHKDFDFVSQIKIPICLNINNKDYGLIESFVGTPKSKPKLQIAINNLVPKKGIINFSENNLITIKQFWQTISEEERK